MLMKQAVWVGDRKVEIRQVPMPEVNGSPIIRVTDVGICGSDVHFWEEGSQHLGVHAGHEYSGIIYDPGSSSFQKGDRVVGYTQNPKNEPCGRCPNCLVGDFDRCTNRTVKIGIGSELEHPGAFAEYVSWFPSGMFLLPDSVSNEEAALIEPAAVALHAMSLSEIKPGANILILGGGIIGQCVAEWARMYGASTIVLTETNKKKIEFIRNIGIVDHVLNGRDPEVEKQINALLPHGMDMFFDCVAVEGPFNMAIRNLKRGGTGVLVGVSMHPVSFDYYSTVVYQKRLQGSKGHVPTDFQAVFAALTHHTIDLKKYITRRIRLSDLQQGLEQIRDQGDDVKVLVKCMEP